VTATAAVRHVHRQTLGFGQFVRGRGFHLPVDVAVDRAGLVHALSRSCSYKERAPRITVASLDERTCREIGTFGIEPGCLFEPTALAIDGEDRVYVADEHLHTVTVYDRDGGLVRRWGEHGSTPGRLDRPSGLAFDANGDLHVVDHVNARVQRFTVEGRYRRARPSLGHRRRPRRPPVRQRLAQRPGAALRRRRAAARRHRRRAAAAARRARRRG
jgi:hypothetical protein